MVRQFAASFAGLEVHQAIEVDACHGAVVLRMTLVQGGDVAGLPLERIEPLHQMLEGVRKRPRGPIFIHHGAPRNGAWTILRSGATKNPDPFCSEGAVLRPAAWILHCVQNDI